MSTPRETLLNISTVFIALCTVFLTGFTVYRHMATRPVPDILGRQPPVMLEDWRELADVGHRLGPEEAEVTVVVFIDFECPTCNTFATKTYPDFQARYSGRKGYVRGEFDRSARVTLLSTASVGNERWLAMAKEVGIRDTLAFEDCLEDSGTARLVALDTLAVTRLGARGTPTFLFNHLLVHGFLRTEGLDEIFRTVLPTGLEVDGGINASVEPRGSLSRSP